MITSCFIYSQQPNSIEISPGGFLDGVFDSYGNKYSLDNIKIPKENITTESRFVDNTCDSGIFRLHFTAGSGMLDSEHPDAAARRAVVCRVFHDVSEFINSPLKNIGNTNRVEIWVRDINGLTTNPQTSNTLGLATSFYSIPNAPTSIVGGIVDNEIWKTTTSGIDSYTNVGYPLSSTGGSFFLGYYHGLVALNFSNPAFNWNLNLGTNPTTSQIDLYSVVLHEVTHALGFSSLFDENGNSKFGANNRYYSRYDLRLRDFSNTQNLIIGSGISQMYDFQFNTALNTSILHPNCTSSPPTSTNNQGIITCNSTVNFVGNNNVSIPTYTPDCYERPSSFSHFSNQCYTPLNTTDFFVMNSGLGQGVNRRTISNEERNTLCDIGFSLNTTFGNSSTLNFFNYQTTVCNGNNIVGINDGMLNSSYTFQYTIGQAPINLNGLLNNDIGSNLNFEGLQDVYDINSLLSVTSGSNTTVPTFATNTPGIHLLRYVPFDNVTQIRGNITYVYVFVFQQGLNCNVQPSTCNLVVNGDFEINNQQVNSIGQLDRACNWSSISGSPDYFRVDAGGNFVDIPCNYFGEQGSNNNIGNAYAGFHISRNVFNNSPYYERIRTELSSGLLPNTNYNVSFDVSLAEQFSNRISNIQIYLNAAGFGLPGSLQLSAVGPNDILQSSTTVVNNVTGWTRLTFNFNSGNGGQRFLYIGGIINENINLTLSGLTVPQTCNGNGNPSNLIYNSTYYYLDNVSLIPTDSIGLLTLPEQICINQTLTDLTNFLNPAPVGGTFTGTGVTGNTFNASTAGVGSHIITYTYINNLGCQTIITDTINVNPTNDAGTLSGNQTLTIGQTFTMSSTVTGGTWSSNNNSVFTVNNNGLITAIANGTATLSYTVSTNTICPPDVKTVTITVQNSNTNCTNTTFWNGSSWSNGIPNNNSFLNTTLVFGANFTSTEDLFACSVLVTPNATVEFKHIGSSETSNIGHTLNVNYDVTVALGATLKFEDDASLLQINNSINSGEITYLRKTPQIGKFDYVYWCSPVANQTLFDLSPDTLADKYFTFNPTIPNWEFTPPTITILQPAKGYIIRGPQQHILADYFDGIFKGVPNNGTITTPVVSSPSNINLIGNPYPSALDINCFLTDPANSHLGGAVYLWAHNIPIDWSGGTQQGFPGTAIYNYNVNSYAAYNLMGGVGTGIVNVAQGSFLTDRSLGKIAAGQSFFIESGNNNSATFKNSMRIGSSLGNNGQFYRMLPTTNPSESSTCLPVNRHRIWIQMRNLTALPQQFKQTLIGFTPDATTAATLDRKYDARAFVAEPYNINLYTLTTGNTVPLTIQGRQLTTPFNQNEVIPLGYTCKLSGAGPNTIQIAASEFDGMFANQPFYLRETISTGIYAYYDIAYTPHEFTLNSTILDNSTRFAIVFTAPNTTRVVTEACGSTLPQLDTQIFANNVSGAQSYRWHIVRSDGVQTYYDSGLRVLRLNSIPLSNFTLFNTTYTIRVSTKVNNIWYPYSFPCSVTTPTPVTSLTTCTGLVMTSKSTMIYANVVNFVNGYSWEVKNLTTNFTRTFQTPLRNFNLSNAALVAPSGFVTPNTQYSVKVRPLNRNGVDNLFFSTVCYFNTGTVVSKMATNSSKISNFDVSVAPNPFNENFEIKLVSNSEENIEVVIYDILGKRIEYKSLIKNDLEKQNFGKNYSAGVYTVIITQGEETRTIKVIKQ